MIRLTLRRLATAPQLNTPIEACTAKQLGHVLQTANKNIFSKDETEKCAFRAIDVVHDCDARDVYRFFIGFQNIDVFGSAYGAPLLQSIVSQLKNVCSDLRTSEIVEFAQAAANVAKTSSNDCVENNGELLEMKLNAISELFGVISAAFLHRCQAAESSLLIDLAAAFAAAGVKDELLFNKIAVLTSQQINVLDKSKLATLLKSFALLKLRNDQLLFKAAHVLDESALSRLSPESICDIAFGYARFRIVFSRLRQQIVDYSCRKKTDNLSFVRRCELVVSIARMGGRECLAKGLLDVSDVTVRDFESLSSSFLARFALSAVDIGLLSEAPQATKFWDVLSAVSTIHKQNDCENLDQQSALDLVEAFAGSVSATPEVAEHSKFADVLLRSNYLLSRAAINLGTVQEDIDKPAKFSSFPLLQSVNLSRFLRSLRLFPSKWFSFGTNELSDKIQSTLMSNAEKMPLKISVSVSYSLMLLLDQATYRENFHGHILGSTLSILCSRIHHELHQANLANPNQNANFVFMSEQKVNVRQLSFLRKFCEVFGLPAWSVELENTEGGEMRKDEQSGLFEKIANSTVVYNEISSILLEHFGVERADIQSLRVQEKPMVLPLVESNLNVCYETHLPGDFVLDELTRKRKFEVELLRKSGWGVVEVPFAEWRRLNSVDRVEFLRARRDAELTRLSA